MTVSVSDYDLEHRFRLPQIPCSTMAIGSSACYSQESKLFSIHCWEHQEGLQQWGKLCYRFPMPPGDVLSFWVGRHQWFVKLIHFKRFYQDVRADTQVASTRLERGLKIDQDDWICNTKSPLSSIALWNLFKVWFLLRVNLSSDNRNGAHGTVEENQLFRELFWPQHVCLLRTLTLHNIN